MKKNPWIAAILNFLIPGLGYLYAGTKRTWFAVLLLIGSIASGYWMFTNSEIILLMTSFWATLISLCWGVAFAIDGYNEVKQTKSSK